ncbi:SCO2522 family protein [Streptomyces syringium]|uniref:SCO2522 family protein n=1 Tax=Streptomyces syringium TaxID=76729 RepID=UPI0037D96361
MMETTFREESADPRTQSLPLSHLSLELGHLYMEDFAAGPGRLREQFTRVKPWADAARLSVAGAAGARRPRVSTCFLVDDYFTRFSSPAELVPMLLAEAEACGLTIDYLAREAGCAGADGMELASLVEGRLVESPPVGSNGSRPAVREIGWLCNGERTPAAGGEAMSGATGWAAPAETGARRHSVFMDVELWDDGDRGRTWSCPFLAAVWQLLRLGLLRREGRPVLQAVPWGGERGGFPRDWDDLPPLVQLNPSAAPFAAYGTFSVLPSRFLPVEHAVRLVLGQVALEEAVLRRTAERADREGFAVPPAVADRAAYAFYAEP